MTRTDSFLAGLVLVGFTAALAIADGEAGDYALLVPGHEPICAKSERVCIEARTAIREGRWPIAPRNAPTSCIPSPGCFSDDSNTIRGFNR